MVVGHLGISLRLELYKKLCYTKLIVNHSHLKDVLLPEFGY
ncbi:hypothetical protein EJK51_0226 [Moraxella catarrhalis]|uniref:Uncharacterized protein n=1 Tax=Moraxella catarrhalis TaxID=480 RepID=A0ABY0BJG8_MORCA|nr:hypothetical protein EJK52_0227 [Moraxella catarrhalis]AZQ90662.1 hypothetical protein EJK51_0226 [Moraxella catarrhalis]RUO14298.1 hypothetical protein EJK49_1425 [Moraxella catarrhalis]RUO16004.1 hypothetical protein EJK54_0826 [Moraxella catarrhalis]